MKVTCEDCNGRGTIRHLIFKRICRECCGLGFFIQPDPRHFSTTIPFSRTRANEYKRRPVNQPPPRVEPIRDNDDGFGLGMLTGMAIGSIRDDPKPFEGGGKFGGAGASDSWSTTAVAESSPPTDPAPGSDPPTDTGSNNT